MSIVFVPLSVDWVDCLVEAEEICFTHNGWSRNLIVSTLAEPSTQYWGLFQSCGLNALSQAQDYKTTKFTPAQVKLLAYGAVRFLSGEGEILSLAVLPEERGQGLGKKLLFELERVAREKQVRTMFLEVRESNQAAKALYLNAGYEYLGRRKKYYRHPTEDALVLQHRLAMPSPGPVGSEI